MSIAQRVLAKLCLWLFLFQGKYFHDWKLSNSTVLFFIYMLAEQFPLFCKYRHAVDTFRDYKYLGTRIRVDGTVGEYVSFPFLWVCKLSWILQILFPHSLTYIFYPSRYKWMTYGEAGTARSAIGSGLIFHGILKVKSEN